jgi:cytochrome P450
MKAWIVTRYADVKQVALNNRQISADRLTPFFKTNPEYQRGSIESLVRYLNHWMVFRDPPDHTRLRRLFTKAFTPTAVANLRPNIEDIVAHLIDAMLAKARRGETVDYVTDFAYPLPASVIMDLLGVPRADLERVKVWSDDIALFIGTAHPRRGAHRGAYRRHDQPARAGARRPRRAQHRRDHRHRHPAAVRRPRDHRQPYRQRLPLFDEASRRVGTADSRSLDGGLGGRGIPAL